MFVITAYYNNDSIYSRNECNKYHEMKELIMNLVSFDAVERIEVEHHL